MTPVGPPRPDRVWRSFSGDETSSRIVLVHGSLDRSAGLLRLERRLDARHDVIRYDRRGYGRSRPLEGPYDFETHLADLISLLDGESPSVVFGHSYGGVLALAAASRPVGAPSTEAAGSAISGVIVYEPPMMWESWWPRPADQESQAPEDVAEAFMRRLIGDQRWERLGAATRRARRSEGAALVAELESLRRGCPWDLASVRCPVLVLRGERAREQHRRACDEITAAIDAARLVVVNGAGHFGPNTHADAVAAAIDDCGPLWDAQASG